MNLNVLFFLISDYNHSAVLLVMANHITTQFLEFIYYVLVQIWVFIY